MRRTTLNDAPSGHVDSTAVVEDGASLHASASVWQGSKVRRGATVGPRTRLGGWVYVGLGVSVGADCKIENCAQLFEGAEVSDGVLLGPGVLLTNDRFPRAVTPAGVMKGADDWRVSGVAVERGASIGAGTIVLPGVRVGEWALVGAGAVVTHDVAPFGLAIGVPARQVGYVCRCAKAIEPPGSCEVCGRRYELVDARLVETPLP